MGYEARPISYLAVDRVLLCITDPLEQGRFTGIRSTDNEDSKVRISGPKLCSFFPVDCHRWCYTLRSPSKHFLQVFEKTSGLFSSLRRMLTLISHIDDSTMRTTSRQTSTNMNRSWSYSIPEHNMDPSFRTAQGHILVFFCGGVRPPDRTCCHWS